MGGAVMESNSDARLSVLGPPAMGGRGGRRERVPLGHRVSWGAAWAWQLRSAELSGAL